MIPYQTSISIHAEHANGQISPQNSSNTNLNVKYRGQYQLEPLVRPALDLRFGDHHLHTTNTISLFTRS